MGGGLGNLGNALIETFFWLWCRPLGRVKSCPGQEGAAGPVKNTSGATKWYENCFSFNVWFDRWSGTRTIQNGSSLKVIGQLFPKNGVVFKLERLWSDGLCAIQDSPSDHKLPEVVEAGSTKALRKLYYSSLKAVRNLSEKSVNAGLGVTFVWINESST